MTTPTQAHIRRVVRAVAPHMDSNQTAAFSRELEYLIARTYDVQYPALRARDFIPIDSSIPEYAQSFVWRSYDQVAAAKIIASYADDLPRVDIVGQEVAQAIRDIGASYGFNVTELAAIGAGIAPIDTMRAIAARQAIETAIDELAAFGSEQHGLPGFLNHPVVPVLGPPDIHGDWMDPSTTAMDILEDLYKIEKQIPKNTKNIEAPDTLLLPPELLRKASQAPITEMRPEETALSVFLKNAVSIRNIDQWYHLENAGSTGGNRIVCYKRSPDKLSLVIPKEFTQLPMQARGLAFEVPCMARIGGVSVKRPLSMLYVDGV